MFSFDQLIKLWRSSLQQPLRQRLTNDLMRKAKAHVSTCCDAMQNDPAYQSPIKFQPDEQQRSTTNGSDDGKRFIVSNSFLSLIVSGHHGTIDVFVMPVGAGKNLQVMPEKHLKPKLTLQLAVGRELSWMLDDCPVSEDEFLVLLTGLLRDAVMKSQMQLSSMPGAGQGALPVTFSLTGSLKSMVAEKHYLMQKIVNQQEQIQERIAREIHDAVISDVMAVRRSLTDDGNMSEIQLLETLDAIAVNLREICHDLAPRDLHDLGLKIMLQELVHTASDRAGLQSGFTCNATTLDLPDEVALHIYRIFQECFNNIEKHAGATRADLDVQVEGNEITFQLTDNGTGYDTLESRSTKFSGLGTSIVKERSELINCFFPTELKVSSDTHGTKITLCLRKR
jgi:hypothetical protein